MKLFTSAALIFTLAACGGGGGGGSSSSPSPAPSVTFCINSQVDGCSYSPNDPTQTTYGWWQGTSTLGTTLRPVFMAASSLGSFQLYIGNDFAGGYFAGSSTTQGSILSLSSVVGVDPLASAPNSAILRGSDGGVITQKILSYTQPNYNLVGAALSMRYTYNPVGDEPLSSYVGRYVNGTSSLVINSNGQVTATYPAPIFIPNNPTQMCTLSTTVSTATLMKNVVIGGTDSCGGSPAMGLYYFTSSGVGQMVLRLSLANNLSRKAVVFSGVTPVDSVPVASTLSFPFKAITDSERTQNSFETGQISGRSIATPVVTFGGTSTANTVYSANNVFSYRPINSSVVTNVNASASTTTSTVIFNNFSNGRNPVSENSTITSYYDNTGKLLGSISDDGVTYLTTSGGTVPVSGRVGDQSQFYTQDILYTSFGVSRKCGTETATVFVEPDTATTVIVKQVITKSVTVANVCGVSTTTTGYTRFTQTSSKDLYADITSADISARVTID